MFEKYFVEFYVSEQELKENIFSSLKSLNELEPEKWSSELLEYADLNKSSQEILLSLSNTVPALSVINKLPPESELMECLRLVAIELSMILSSKHLEYYFMKHFYMFCSTYLLGFRYLLATEVLSEKLNKEPDYSPDDIFTILTSKAFNPEPFPLVWNAAKEAHEETQRLFTDPDANEYVNYILDFERGIEKYIKDNSAFVVMESFIRLVNEAIAKNIGNALDNLQLENDISKTGISEVADLIMKIVRQKTKQRLELEGRGGKRERQGFVWTHEHKVAFFLKVAGLPKIENKPMWDYAYSELMKKDFNSKIIDYIKTETAFKDVPEKLFRKAVSTWRNYQDNFERIKPDKKAKAFAYRYALLLLGYPYTKYSTINRYFGDGKRLSQAIIKS